MRILLDIREVLQELPAPETDRDAILGMKREIIKAASRHFDDAAYKEEGDMYAVDPEYYSEADVEDTLLGALDPGKLVAEAEAWNERIRKGFITWLRALFGAKDGMIDTAADFAMDTTKTYMVSVAAMMIDNRFEPAADYAVFYADEYTLKPLVSESLLDDIKAHPERYAIVDVSVTNG